MPKPVRKIPVVEQIEAIETCLKHEQMELSEWEETFFISIQEQQKRQGKHLQLSPKQLEKLEQLYDKT